MSKKRGLFPALFSARSVSRTRGFGVSAELFSPILISLSPHSLLNDRLILPLPSLSPGLVLYVADTNNHRLRKISGDVANGAGTVTCLAGR